MDKEVITIHREVYTTLQEIRDIFDSIGSETAMANQLIDGLENILLKNSKVVDYGNEDVINFFQKIISKAKAIKRWVHYLEEASADVLNEITFEEDLVFTKEETERIGANEN